MIAPFGVSDRRQGIATLGPHALPAHTWASELQQSAPLHAQPGFVLFFKFNFEMLLLIQVPPIVAFCGSTGQGQEQKADPGQCVCVLGGGGRGLVTLSHRQIQNRAMVTEKPLVPLYTHTKPSPAPSLRSGSTRAFSNSSSSQEGYT